ncbi:phosphatidylinositol 3,4,5-trisphosphate 3-phosphatase and protein-tyrosine-phosphatase PTEN2A-like [Carex rostrata]
MMENRTILGTTDLDGFDKRKLPSPGFEVEVVLVEYNGPAPASSTPASATATPKPDTDTTSTTETSSIQNPTTSEVSNKEVTTSQENKDDVFSDNESDEKKQHGKDSSTSNVSQALEKITLKKEDSAVKSTDASPGESGKSTVSTSVPDNTSNLDSNSMSEFKAIAADASVFSFGDEEDYESE